MEGNRLRLSGTVEPIRPSGIPYLFDFGTYQTRAGVQGLVRLSNYDVTDSTPTWAFATRHALLSRLPHDSREWVNWLLFGERISGDFQSAIVQFSLVDLMVVSGLHIHFFATILLHLLARGKPQWSDHFLVVGLLIPLAHLMGWPLAMMRSLALLGLNACLTLLGWRCHSLDRLSVIGMLFLLVNPRWIFSSGYQYSFLATFWIAYMQSYVHHLPRWSRPMVVNSLITLGLLPLILASNYEISLWSPLLHWMLSPVILILFLGALLCLIGVPLSGSLTLGFRLLEDCLGWLQPIPLMVQTGAPSKLWNISWWITFLLTLSWLHKRYRCYQVMSQLILVSLLIGQMVLLHVSPSYEIVYLDVAQGDATLIITPNQHEVILIDTGGHFQVDYATTRIIPYLKARGIRSIDAVFITHDDIDHNGALSSLVNHFPVRPVYTNSLRSKYVFEDVTITNYNPLTTTSDGDDNEVSMVLGWTIDTIDYLVMGDASTSVEEMIITVYPYLKTDILRIGHHGSKTSTSESFLTHVSPQVAIISVGYHNRYGHPHDEVIERLERYHIATYQTALFGTLQIVQKNGNVTLRGTHDLV